jgi:hypothetical protein
VWVALRLEEIRRRRNRPVLAVRYEASSRFLLKTPIETRVPDASGNLVTQEVAGEYARIQVKNLGRQTALDCRGYLLKVEQLNTATKSYIELFEDTIPLAWSHIVPRSDGRGIDLPCDVPYFLNIGWVQDGGDQFNLDLVPRPLYVRNLIREQGVYRLTVYVTAEGADAVPQQFSLMWNAGKSPFGFTQEQVK